jgi:hypothetical protein
VPVQQADRSREIALVRLTGALVVGFAIIRLGVFAWSNWLFEAASAETGEHGGFDDYERRNELFSLLDVSNTINLGAQIAGAAALAMVTAMLAWRSRRLRVPAGLAALGYATMVATWLRVFSSRFFEPTNDPSSAALWGRLGATGEIAAWLATMGIVVIMVRALPDARRRKIVLGCVALGAFVIALHAWDRFLPGDAGTLSWWATRVPLLGVRISTLLSFIGSLGVGLGSWLSAVPRSEDEANGLDRAAARGLELARAAVWWRAGLGVLSVVLVVLGMMAMQRAQQAALFGGPSSSVTPWTLAAAPWLSYLEIGLGLLLAVGLGACVLQRRSTRAAVLVGVGAIAILSATIGSFGLAVTLHDALRSLEGGRQVFGWSLSDDGGFDRHAKLTLALDPMLRWIGLGGTACTLAGLAAVLRDTTGASPKRAVRFLIVAGVLTIGWLHGRDALAHLGAGVLLLIPVVLGAAIWMLLDLTTFLGEVAEALAPRPEPSSPVEPS